MLSVNFDKRKTLITLERLTLCCCNTHDYEHFTGEALWKGEDWRKLRSDVKQWVAFRSNSTNGRTHLWNSYFYTFIIKTNSWTRLARAGGHFNHLVPRLRFLAATLRLLLQSTLHFKMDVPGHFIPDILAFSCLTAQPRSISKLENTPKWGSDLCSQQFCFSVY